MKITTWPGAFSALTAIDTPFAGYQQTTAYRLRQREDDIGEPLSRMAPRSLMAPPGVPDFFTRARTVVAGNHTLTGRAWSGLGSIRGVDVSVDGGATWGAAVLDPGVASTGTWMGWSYEWAAEPGEHELCSRATRRFRRQPAPECRVEPWRLRQQLGAPTPRPSRSFVGRRPPG